MSYYQRSFSKNIVVWLAKGALITISMLKSHEYSNVMSDNGQCYCVFHERLKKGIVLK